MFEQFPYTNFHELNLDWIVQKVKEAYSPDNPPDNMVLSVNGETGDVILYPNAVVTLPEVSEGTWNIHRISDGESSGIQFTPDRAQRIEGTNRYDMYDAGNPPPYPVTAVNGQTGNVSITIPVESVNGQTGTIILYQDALIRLPDVSAGTWNIRRMAGGISRGIQFTPTGAERIEDTNRYAMYDAGNPPPYPVSSVNGQTGNVSINIPVTSVNGKTGAVVTPFTDPTTEILNIDEPADDNYWGLEREVTTGTASLYLDTANNTISAYIAFTPSGSQAGTPLKLLTSADIPSSAGVVSINTKTGAVTLYGTDIYTDANSNKTVSQYLAENAQGISTNAGNISTNATAISTEAGRAAGVEEKIENGIAIIVDGDTASQAVPAGQYAYIKNNTHSLTEGLYYNKSGASFPATGGTADNTIFEAVSGGALNSLSAQIAMSQYSITNIGFIQFMGKLAVINFTNSSGQIPSTGYQLPYSFNNTYKALCQYYNGSSNDYAELRVETNGNVYVRKQGVDLNATYVLAQLVAYLN